MSKVDRKTYFRDYKRTLVYQARRREHDELKYWRVVRRWAQKRYNMKLQDLETILFLYSEPLFSRQQFHDYEAILSWEPRRFDRYLENGWIVVWRDHKGYKQAGRRYVLSHQMKHMCNSIYKKLHQEEPIPENRQNNPIYGKGPNIDKRYRKIIRKMNKLREKKLEK